MNKEDFDKAIKQFIDNKEPYIKLWNKEVIVSRIVFDEDGYVQTA
jgi:hypothetical protein